jgi:twinkle protein
MNLLGEALRRTPAATANMSIARHARPKMRGRVSVSSAFKFETAWFFGNASAATSGEGLRMLSSQLSAKHRAEIEARGLDIGLAQQYGFKSHGDHIAFEYRINGKVHNTKIRRGKGDMPWAESGKPLVLWNRDCLAGAASERIPIITEGEYDGLACIQAGFRDTVSVPNGAPAGENEEGKARYAYLFDGDNLAPDIDKFKGFILGGDGDEKGRFLRDALAVRLGEHRCFWIEWPRGCKDANDVLREYGPGALAECLSNPRRMFVDEVATLDDLPDPPKEASFHLGLDNLAPHLRFPRKGFVTILGPYESGKSTLLRQLMVNMSMNHGWRSAITCFEESAKWRTVNALRKTYLGMPVDHATDAELREADDWIRHNVVFLRKKPRTLMTAARLINRIEYAVKVYGLNMMIIDPFNEIDHHYSKDTSKTEYIGNLIMDMKDLADNYNIVLICCVHPPSESMRRQTTRKDKFYTLADSADSSHFANKSDIGLCIWRPSREGVTLINIDKIKNTELCGKPTGIELTFNEYADRYHVSATGWEVLSEKDDAA